MVDISVHISLPSLGLASSFVCYHLVKGSSQCNGGQLVDILPVVRTFWSWLRQPSLPQVTGLSLVFF